MAELWQDVIQPLLESRGWLSRAVRGTGGALLGRALGEGLDALGSFITGKKFRLFGDLLTIGGGLAGAFAPEIKDWIGVQSRLTPEQWAEVEPEVLNKAQTRVLSKERREQLSLLGLEPPVSREDLTRAYREQAGRWHPDRNPGQERDCNIRMAALSAARKALNEAFDCKEWWCLN